VHKLLVDTASSEFLFCLDFWEDEGVFKELFGPVVSVVETDLATQLQVTCLHGGRGLPLMQRGRAAAAPVLGHMAARSMNLLHAPVTLHMLAR